MEPPALPYRITRKYSGAFGVDISDKAFLRYHIRDMRSYCNLEKKKDLQILTG
jgi:hypothetical protein